MADDLNAVPTKRRSIVEAVAHRFGMESGPFEATLRATVFPANGTKEQFAAFLVVAKQHNLNPLTKEIFAFPAKGGGIVPVVSVDGWSRIINQHPQMDGLEFDDHREDGRLIAITAKVYRKDRSRPVAVTEYMSECARGTDTWKQWPARMLRHKATIQAARYAFGFSGIYDQDEAERINEASGKGLGAGHFLKGAEAKDEIARIMSVLAACDTQEALDAAWEAEAPVRLRLSDNRQHGLEEAYEQHVERLYQAYLREHDPALAASITDDDGGVS